MGLQRGDTIVQMCGNRADVFVVMAACYINSFRSVALQPLGGIEDQLYILNNCEAKLLIVDADRMERARELLDKSTQSFEVACHDSVPSTTFLWDEFSPSIAPALTDLSEPDDIVRLIYTGGTTGKSKGVMGTSCSLATNALFRMAGHNWVDLRLLCSTPLSHASGAMIVPVLWHGGTIVLHDGFNPDRLIHDVVEGTANGLYLVPTMIYRLLDHPDCARLSTAGLRMLMYGAAPISPPRLFQARALLGPILIQHYGLTEAPSTVLSLSETDHLDDSLLASAGKPYPGVTVKILDQDGREVPRGQVGEICIRGDLVMKGYFKEPELTAQALKNGWLYSGDLACQNERGYFFIVDRAKDMIISGGFNVYPKEVEDVIATHPAVASVAVIGIPDADWGEAVKAVVVLKEGQSVTAQELTQRVKAAKGAVQAPKSVDFVTTLPLTSLGKLDKKALRAVYWNNKERSIN
jgi:fatty-acyl-CoA synthase